MFLAPVSPPSYAYAPMDPNVPTPQTPYVPPTPPPVKKGGMGAGLILALGCFGFLALGFAGIVVLAAISGNEGGGGNVEDKSVLRMKVVGATPEYVRSSGLDELFGGTPVTVRQHVFNLEKAAADKRIKGVLLELGPLEGTGWAKVEELRDALVEFKKSGKFVVAFSEYLAEKE